MSTTKLRRHALMSELDLKSMPDWRRIERVDAGREAWMHADAVTSKYVYRYMSIQTAVATYAGGEFWMKPPRRWDDPYETWWCDQLFRAGSKLVAAKAYRLCWTTRSRDEPFWRLYTCPDRPTVPAVRLRTTVQSLVERMNLLVGEEHGKAFLGRVRYAPVKQLYEIAKELREDRKQIARHAAMALHWKR